jgi:hypothetical protein
LLPETGSTTYRILDALNLFFTLIFTVEIALKMLATLLLEFVSEPWNWFDPPPI